MSLNEIKVHVVDYGRPSLYMRYKDPLSGKQSTKTTGTSNRKEAAKIAAKWEAELQEGRYKSPSKISWVEFKHRYEDEVLASLAKKTQLRAGSVFRQLETLVNPEKLRDLTTDRISQFQRLMRERGLAEQSIKGTLAHLKAALNWAKEVGILFEVPTIRMPQRAKESKLMKGRPITAEEFERMLEKTGEVVGQPLAAEWKHYLKGLWFSGLRLAESLELTWDSLDRPSVDFSGKYVMLRIPGRYQKNNRDQLLPIAPEFAEMLLAVPPEERTGYVFNLHTAKSGNRRIKADRVCRIVSKIGERANVKVNTEVRKARASGSKKSSSVSKTERVTVEVTKYASAHDLRRAFGERWSQRVMPAVLQQLMRHDSIETTMKFYVGRNAETTSDAIYAAAGNTFDNSNGKATVRAPETEKAHGL